MRFCGLLGCVSCRTPNLRRGFAAASVNMSNAAGELVAVGIDIKTPWSSETGDSGLPLGELGGTRRFLRCLAHSELLSCVVSLWKFSMCASNKQVRRREHAEKASAWLPTSGWDRPVAR